MVRRGAGGGLRRRRRCGGGGRGRGLGGVSEGGGGLQQRVDCLHGAEGLREGRAVHAVEVRVAGEQEAEERVVGLLAADGGLEGGAGAAALHKRHLRVRGCGGTCTREGRL